MRLCLTHRGTEAGLKESLFGFRPASLRPHTGCTSDKCPHVVGTILVGGRRIPSWTPAFDQGEAENYINSCFTNTHFNKQLGI